MGSVEIPGRDELWLNGSTHESAAWDIIIKNRGATLISRSPIRKTHPPYPISS